MKLTKLFEEENERTLAFKLQQLILDEFDDSIVSAEIKRARNLLDDGTGPGQTAVVVHLKVALDFWSDEIYLRAVPSQHRYLAHEVSTCSQLISVKDPETLITKAILVMANQACGSGQAFCNAFDYKYFEAVNQYSLTKNKHAEILRRMMQGKKVITKVLQGGPDAAVTINGYQLITSRTSLIARKTTALYIEE